MTSTIWFNRDRTKYYLITDIETLSSGSLTLINSSGDKRDVREDALVPYEVTREEARAWLESQLGDVLGQLRQNLIDSARNVFESRQPSAHETPTELLEHADAIDTVASWLQNVSGRAANRLRAKSGAMRAAAGRSSHNFDDEKEKS